MFQVRLVNGKNFAVSGEKPLLDEAMEAGITFPYSCKSGRCSACKCRVMSGETVALQTEVGLSEAEKAACFILSCVRSAASDLVLDVDTLDGILVPSRKTLACRIDALEKLASDVLKVTLRLPPNALFDFFPGQYVAIIGPNGIRRSYSLAGAGGAGKLLELHIRAVEQGIMSAYWFKQAKKNDLLRLNGPLGTFFLRETVDLDLIFLATGTGMAPVKAILEAISGLSPEIRPASVTVLWGGRTSSDHYFDVESVFPGLDFVPVLSRGGDGYAGASGYVQDVLLASRPDLGRAAVYACGSDAMIQSARTVLQAAGLPGNRFYSDAFVCSDTATSS